MRKSDKPFPGTCAHCPHRFDYYYCLAESLEDFFGIDSTENQNLGAMKINNEITMILRECSITNKGFQYLVTGLTYTISDSSYLSNLKHRLYPAIARQHHTTSDRVEKDIRDAIKRAWTRGNREVLQSHFLNTIPPKKNNPSNLQFLIVMTEIVRNRCSYPCVHLD